MPTRRRVRWHWRADAPSAHLPVRLPTAPALPPAAPVLRPRTPRAICFRACPLRPSHSAAGIAPPAGCGKRTRSRTTMPGATKRSPEHRSSAVAGPELRPAARNEWGRAPRVCAAFARFAAATVAGRGTVEDSHSSHVPSPSSMSPDLAIRGRAVPRRKVSSAARASGVPHALRPLSASTTALLTSWVSATCNNSAGGRTSKPMPLAASLAKGPPERAMRSAASLQRGSALYPRA